MFLWAMMKNLPLTNERILGVNGMLEALSARSRGVWTRHIYGRESLLIFYFFQYILRTNI